MTSESLLWLPLLGMGLLHGIDELICHRARFPMPKWELWSHPLDTSIVFLLVGLAVGLAPTEINQKIYAGIALISILLVTKDEWVHKVHCSGFELWIHSLLFILHPIFLYSIFRGWVTGQNNFLGVTLSLLFVVLCTQLFELFKYWKHSDV